MDLRKLQRYYNDCDPLQPLDPDDPRNVNIDELGRPEDRVRGEGWTNRLARQIVLSGDTPVCRYFTGLPGSGKSTEIRRLAKKLSSGEMGARLLPVVVDAEEDLQLNATIDIPDIMAVLVHRAEQAVLEAEKRSSAELSKPDTLERLWSWVTGKDSSLKELSLEGGASGLTQAMKTNQLLRERVRGTVGIHLSQFLAEVHGQLRVLDDRARRIGYDGLLLIMDSLEKLFGTGGHARTVLASAEEVFASAEYVQLPVHVLYTIPPDLVFRIRMFDKIFLMPMIKLYDRETREPFEPGYRACRAIIRRRINDDDLAELLGDENVESRVRELIAWSGGYPREIMRMLRFVLETDTTPITKEDFRAVFDRLSDSYRTLVYGSGQPAIDWLARVSVTQEAIQDTDEERDLAGRMLGNNVVLHYQNQKRWWDIHPAITDIPEIRTAMRRFRAQEHMKDSSAVAPGGKGAEDTQK